MKTLWWLLLLCLIYWLFLIAFVLFICYLFFRFFFLWNILGIFFWCNSWYFIEKFSNDCLSLPINNELWHARVGHFNNPFNKQNKTMFLLYLSSDLSKRLTFILSSNLRLAYQLCNFLLISVVLTLFVHQKFSFIEVGRYGI